MTAPTLHKTLELLAPAGGPDALRAAVRNGADAVYLGTGELNARRGAENFTIDTLAEACRYAHLRNTKVYLTANVAILQHEMPAALDMVARAWEAGVDAVIVQDLGLLRNLHTLLPEVRLHASTQIDAHNAASISALAEMGVSRVTLARELSVAEIASLVSTSPVELENFAHGSLCFCHSGQCLMSSLIGGRSANRGMCAQPCRLPYDLVDGNGRLVDIPGRYLLSPRDLCSIELLPALIDAGVAAVKIEGRMKSPEYVASVVSVYRSAIDRALADASAFAVRASEFETLEEAFNRGFTQAYLADIRDDRMMSYTRPNNRGVLLGRVTRTAPGSATIDLSRSLEAEDTIEFWTGSGHFAQLAGELRLGSDHVHAAPSGARVSVTVERLVRPGDRVFRVQNAALLDAARRSWQSAEERRPVPLTLTVTLRRGEAARLEVAAAGLRAEAVGPVVELARTKAVTADEVAEQVGRLGGTPYAVADTTVRLDAGVGIGYSVLHRLRREAIESLDAARLAPWTGRPRSGTLGSRVALPVSPPAPAAVARPALVVVVSSPAAVGPCRAAGADEVLVASAFVTSDADGILFPRVAHEREIARLIERAEGARGRIVAGNLGLVAELGRRGMPVEADWGLNVVNPWAAEALAHLGASAVWASPELSGRQLAALVDSSPVPVGVVVGGRLELMVAEHCILQAAGACDHACARCARRRSVWSLRDRKGYDMPVTTDVAGRAHLYNAVPLDLSRALPEILEARIAALRLDLESSAPEDAAVLTRAWRDRLELALQGRAVIDRPIQDPSTAGHFYRGLR